MKTCMFLFCFFLGNAFAHCQVIREVEESAQEVPARLVGPDDLGERGNGATLGSVASVELNLRTFHRSIQSWVSVLQTEKRMAGRGWSVERSEFQDWKSAIDKAISKRQELVDEAKLVNVDSDDFWKKVIDYEIAAERELSDMLQNVLPPDQQDNFLIEHSKELGVCILTSRMFSDQAKLDRKTIEMLLQIRKDSFVFQANAIRGKPVPPGKFLALQRAFIASLTPDQFGVLLVLTGRKDSDTSLEEHMSSRISKEERVHLVEAIPALKKYVKASGNK